MTADRRMGEGMAVWRGHAAMPAALRSGVVGIGNFDGVHLGHRRLVETVLAQARAAGRPAIVLTFEPHPRSFFTPAAPLFRLTPEPVKLKVLAALGLDATVVWPFDARLATTSAADFVGGFIAREIGAAAVVVGDDFHFGHRRGGTPAVLRELCAANGLACTIIAPVQEEGRTVSSSAIREALQEGRIGAANGSLGYRWFVEGEVRHGDKRGRDLGFPTANVDLGAHCRLRHGIYAVRAAIAPGGIRNGVASFGRRPTFDDGAPLLEVNLFDFTGDLYGKTLEVEFVDWIRGEERFESADALISRMNQDAEEAKGILAGADGMGPASLIGAAGPKSG